MLVTSEEELNTARRLGNASKIQILTEEGIKDLSKGTSEIITKIESGISASVNGNLTGIYIRNNNLVTRYSNNTGESFHVTIINK